MVFSGRLQMAQASAIRMGLLPGVSFSLKDEGVGLCLRNIKRLEVVSTYCGARWTTFLMDDPPRWFLKRSMFLNCTPGARSDDVARYDLDHGPRLKRRIRFLKIKKAVERRLSTWRPGRSPPPEPTSTRNSSPIQPAAETWSMKSRMRRSISLAGAS